MRMCDPQLLPASYQRCRTSGRYQLQPLLACIPSVPRSVCLQVRMQRYLQVGRKSSVASDAKYLCITSASALLPDSMLALFLQLECRFFGCHVTNVHLPDCKP